MEGEGEGEGRDEDNADVAAPAPAALESPPVNAASRLRRSGEDTAVTAPPAPVVPIGTDGSCGIPAC